MLGETVAGLTLVSQFGETRASEMFVGECDDGRCAVKILRAELAGDAARVDRAIEIAKTAGAVDHRGIEFVLEAGRDGDRVYLLGDLVPGMPASRLVERRPFEPESARTILRYAAEGLAAAHAIGVHHHALEPLLVHVGYASDRVVVRDFGLATLIDPPAADSDDAAAWIAAAAYRAPELWAADPSAAGAPADVYALGCIAVALMTGHGPFMVTTLAAAARAHRDEPAAPTRTWVPEIPVMLDDVIRRMVAKDPAMRPTMADVRDELGGVHRTAVFVAARPPPEPPPERPQPFVPPPRPARDVVELMAELAEIGNDEVTPPPGEPPKPE